jgi:CheY-like chemotaxis protein
MRVLVADQNAVLLAAISATFGRHCDLVTATRRQVCLEHAERQKFDVVVAGDKLADYTGLELLSEVAALYPGTLLIFTASPARLKRLGNRLDLFGLLETISYPLSPRKLLESLKLARRVLRRGPARKVRHVVLESEWDTGERLGLIEQELDASGDEGWHAPDPPAHRTTSVQAAGPRGRVAPNAERGGATGPDSFVEGPAGHDDADDFVFAPAQPATAGAEGARALVALPASAGPAVRAVSARVSRAVVVSNDPVFDQPPVLEEPPIEAAPAEPEWAEDGAANDMVFEPTLPGPSRSATPKKAGSPNGKLASGPGAHAPADPRNAAKRPRSRAPTKPSAAQLAAFERALARRNAERSAVLEEPARAARPSSKQRVKKETLLDARALGARASSLADEVGSMFTGSRGSGRAGAAQNARVTESIAADLRGITATGTSKPAASSASLSQLARMAATKRPLADSKPNRPPQRTLFMVGSGLAVALLVGLLGLELLRTPAKAEHMPQTQGTPAPFAAPASDTGTPPGQMFAPSAPQPAANSAATAANLPQAPNGDGEAQPDPPPPPALEHPGPMEPPSAMHSGPALGMVPPGFEPQPDADDPE